MRDIETLINRIKKKIVHIENQWIEYKRSQINLISNNSPRFEINSIDKKLASIKLDLQKNHVALNLVKSSNTSALNEKISVGDRILLQGRNSAKVLCIADDASYEHPEFGILSPEDALAKFLLTSRYGHYISLEEGEEETLYRILPV